MRLNRWKWTQELRRVEAELKQLKKMRSRPRYERTFPFWKYHDLQAEATRLYCLRRTLKGKELELKSFRYLEQSSSKRYVWSYLKKASWCLVTQAGAVAPITAISLILDGVPYWKERFLEPAETTTQILAPEQASLPPTNAD